MTSDVILVLVVGTALAFDFTNGFHDTANVVATSISTGAARPSVAIWGAARFTDLSQEERRLQAGFAAVAAAVALLAVLAAVLVGVIVMTSK